jgi:LPXTG-motif cell wall-anchored protein
VALLVFSLASQSAGASVAVSSVTLKVYSDGTAAVTQVATAGANDTSVSLQLLSPIIASPVVFDQTGSSLYFQITGANITIYTVGATGMTLEYATTALTSKQGTVWTLAFAAYYNTTVTLPQRSTLLSVSGTPSQLSNNDGSPVVVVSPGQWKIDYGVPVQVPTSSSTTSSTSTATSTTTSTSSVASSSSSSSATSSSSSGITSTSTAASSSSGSSTLVPTSSSSSTQSGSSRGNSSSTNIATSPSASQDLAIAGIATALVAGGALLYLRRRNAPLGPQNLELRPDDVKVIEFISEKGGKVLEPEIRMRFALPKTSAWRQIKRLERLGYVKVTKIGSQNQIELLKK